MSTNWQAIAELDGFGEKTAVDIVSGLQRLRDMIQELLRCIDVQTVEEVVGSLAGKSFVLTGAMSRGRKLIAKDIEAAGGEVKSSVGKGLGFLVQADPSSESGKSRKAAKLGIPVISEADLMAMIH